MKIKTQALVIQQRPRLIQSSHSLLLSLVLSSHLILDGTAAAAASGFYHSRAVIGSPTLIAENNSALRFSRSSSEDSVTQLTDSFGAFITGLLGNGAIITVKLCFAVFPPGHHASDSAGANVSKYGSNAFVISPFLSAS